MSCRDVQEELSAYLDGELSESRKDEVARHLEQCQCCRCHANQLVELITITKGMASPALREGFVDEIMKDISSESKKLPIAASVMRTVQQLISLLFMRPAFYYIVILCLMGRFFLSPAQDSRGDYIALSDTAFQKALSQRSVDPERLLTRDGNGAVPDRMDNNSHKEEHFDVHKKNVPLRLAVRRILRPDRPGNAGHVLQYGNAQHL
ncbi:MAG: anti-sigma factor family protein [Candidatus Xenobiia bacterium LiM19]